MPPQRCRAPRCGRFIPLNTEFCRHHAEEPALNEDVLHYEVQALRHVLARLMELDDLDMQAKHIPRITSASIQVTRTRHQLGERNHSATLALIASVSEEMNDEITR